MPDTRMLHFSLGPVQAFVARARRTRDLWAGSFLLSYLAGQAMRAVLGPKGRIVFPAVQSSSGDISDELLQAICAANAGDKVSSGPRIGTLPNRFKAEIPAGFDPESCVQAVQASWEKIAASVWERFVAPVSGYGLGTPAIWERQVKGFWEVNWVVGPGDDLLDRRKNWRSHVPAVEPGDKCVIMGNLQELSGFVRSRDRAGQEDFWRALSRSVPDLDIRPDERLSAVALIKRLFPLVAEEAIGWKVRTTGYPSTTYMAAVHWVERMIVERPALAGEFAGAAASLLPGAVPGRGEDFSCLRQAMEREPGAAKLAWLDGRCFFTSSLANDSLWEEGSREAREMVGRMLKKNLEEEPAPFYALLLMDGDRLGANLRQFGGVKISEALKRFSGRAPALVGGHNGFTIYAGGDDLLAMLPLEDALPAAIASRCAYRDAFAGSDVPADMATVSAAIVYAHYHAPLSAIVSEAHRLLEKVAKEETGRDSLAVTVWKTGGPVLTWTAPWRVLLDGHQDLITELAQEVRGKTGDAGGLSGSFLYNLHQRFVASRKEAAPTFAMEDLVRLLAAEYLRAREHGPDRGARSGVDEVENLIRQLLRVCCRSWRDAGGGVHEAEGPLALDGALLVRFIATKGVAV